MQSTLMAAAQAVTLDSPYDSVFVPLVDDLVDALAGDDPAAFLTAVEGRARLLAAERSLRMADVFIGLCSSGSVRSAARLSGSLARRGARRPAAGAPSRARPSCAPGVGFAEGLEEAVDHLSRAVAAARADRPG